MTGIVNKSNKKISPTDQQKIELISNFLVPNNKLDIMEFLFLAETRKRACEKLSYSSDEKVSRVQFELRKVWEEKYIQTLKIGEITLKNDPDFKAVLRNYKVQKYIEDGVCQHCGGRFKGMITKYCSNCGKQKDY